MNPKTPILLVAFFLLTLLQARSSDSAERRSFGGIQPTLSRDGKQIALSFQGAICRMPAEGGVLTRITRGDGWDIEPAWSPDAQQIAFINAPGFYSGPLRIISVETSASIQLPKQILARGRLEFHPDGKRLLGMFASTGQPDRLQWFDLQSGDLTAINILNLDADQRGSMKWALSPDDSSIVLATFQDRNGEQGGNNGPATDLWRVSSNGGEAKKITRWPTRVYGLCWDAQATGLFVVTDRGVAYNDIWHVPFDNPLKGARKTTSGQADEDWPGISADGRWLVHTENSEGATALVRLDLNSGDRRTLKIDKVDFREPISQVRIAVTDAKTGEPVTARVSIKQQNGKFHFPLGALYRFTSGFGHFYARENAELTLPAGKYTLRAWRGAEYSVHTQEFEIAGGDSREIKIALDRWVNMPERGWYSGENHIHANYGYGAWHNTPATIRDQCEGEDLHVANIVVANSDGDGVFDRQFFEGQPNAFTTPRTIIYWNEEFRSTIWGHLTLGNLKQLVEPIFTGFKDTTNPWDIPTNADIADRTRVQQGSVSYTHPANNADSPYDTAYAAKGLPVDITLDRVDTLDVMGGGYDASTRLWYRLLNCGFRVPAAAGTDVFLNRIGSYPPGWGRCYVHLTNKLDYADWIRGQKAGRSFVTTGPMLEWTADNFESGGTLHITEPRKIHVRVRAISQFPLRNLEVVVNGVVVASNAPLATNLQKELAMDQDIQINSAGWIAVRCASANAQSWAGPMFGAHGNPIYVEMPNHPLDASADAKFFLAWLDRLNADLKKRDRVPKGWEHVNLQLDHARGVYRRLANQK